MTLTPPRPNVRGPGSRADADRVASAVTGGLEHGARVVAASQPRQGPEEIGQLRLRLPAGASEAEISLAFQRAVAAYRRGRAR